MIYKSGLKEDVSVKIETRIFFLIDEIKVNVHSNQFEAENSIYILWKRIRNTWERNEGMHKKIRQNKNICKIEFLFVTSNCCSKKHPQNVTKHYGIHAFGGSKGNEETEKCEKCDD